MELLRRITHNDRTPERDRDPFNIRGHHLRNLADLISLTRGRPQKVKEVMLPIMRTTWIAGEPFLKGVAIDLGIENYVQDVAGRTEEEKGAYFQRIISIYNSFLKLDETHPVRLTTEPDEICKACSVGSHCTAAFYPIDDMDCIRNFVDQVVSNSTLLVGKTSCTAETLLIDGQETPAITSVDTTAGTVRNILKSGKFLAQT